MKGLNNKTPGTNRGERSLGVYLHIIRRRPSHSTCILKAGRIHFFCKIFSTGRRDLASTPDVLSEDIPWSHRVGMYEEQMTFEEQAERKQIRRVARQQRTENSVAAVVQIDRPAG